MTRACHSGPMGRVPAFATASLDEDVDRFAAMRPEERLRLFLELCDLTDSIVAARPDRDALRRGTPRSAESEALWARLMTTRGAGGRDAR